MPIFPSINGIDHFVATVVPSHEWRESICKLMQPLTAYFLECPAYEPTLFSLRHGMNSAAIFLFWVEEVKTGSDPGVVYFIKAIG